LVVVAGNVFPSERASQTMDLLLTTPLAGAEIVRQKVRALRRFTLVLAVPLVTVYVAEALVENRLWSEDMWNYLGLSLLSVFVYLSLVKWFSVWVGLRVRSRAAATILPVAVLTLWCAVPPLIVVTVAELLPESRGMLAEAFPGAVFLAALLNYLLYGIIAAVFQVLCLTRADRYLGRVPEGLLPPEQTAPAEEANDGAP